MSEMKDLVRVWAEMAHEKGANEERERILNLIDKLAAGQRSVIEFNPNRADNRNREIVVSTAYQIAALIRGEPKDE